MAPTSPLILTDHLLRCTVGGMEWAVVGAGGGGGWGEVGLEGVVVMRMFEPP